MITNYRQYLTQAEQIHAGALMEHVRTLSHPHMRGRMPGDIGYERASQYVESCFRDIGLVPKGDDGSFRQQFHLETNRILSAQVSVIPETGNERPLVLGEDFVCRGLTGSGDITGEPVFVGYGTRSDTLDELDGIPLEGRIAVSFKHPLPGSDQPELPRSKARRLRERGAVALVLVPNPNREERDRLGVSMVETGEPMPDFPIIVLSESAAVSLAGTGDLTLAARQYHIDISGESASGILPGRMRIQITTEHNPRGSSWNLLGLLPGRDNGDTADAVVIGAHLDHVGIQGESVIFPGAQDDASGVASIIEMARAFSAGPRPEATLLFMAFSAEEAGILGSMHYKDHPAWPLNRTRAMLNMDCMGAGTGLDIRGRKAYPTLFRVLDEINEAVIGIEDTFSDHPPGGADAEAFQQSGVPNMFFVSRRPYSHLHMKSDTPETLNPPVFESITRLGFLTAAEFASDGFPTQES